MTEPRHKMGDALKRIMMTGPQSRQQSAPVPGSTVPKSRQGRRGLLSYHDPATIKQVQELALERDTTQQKLITEALNLLFVKYGKPPIA
jgi:hypothetical protein